MGKPPFGGFLYQSSDVSELGLESESDPEKKLKPLVTTSESLSSSEDLHRPGLRHRPDVLQDEGELHD